MKKFSLSLVATLFMVSPVVNANMVYHGNPNYDLKITNYYHPSYEPKGLYIVDFMLVGAEGINMAQHTYRVYCPTKTVRSVSDGKMGQARTATQEDKEVWSDDYTLRFVTKTICK